MALRHSCIQETVAVPPTIIQRQSRRWPSSTARRSARAAGTTRMGKGRRRRAVGGVLLVSLVHISFSHGLDCHLAPDTAFKQQRLKAWQPILTPKTVLPTLFIIGIIFAPIGALLVWGSSLVGYPVSFPPHHVILMKCTP